MRRSTSCAATHTCRTPWAGWIAACGGEFFFFGRSGFFLLTFPLIQFAPALYIFTHFSCRLAHVNTIRSFYEMHMMNSDVFSLFSLSSCCAASLICNGCDVYIHNHLFPLFRSIGGGWFAMRRLRIIPLIAIFCIETHARRFCLLLRLRPQLTIVAVRHPTLSRFAVWPVCDTLSVQLTLMVFSQQQNVPRLSFAESLFVFFETLMPVAHIFKKRCSFGCAIAFHTTNR